MKKTLIVNVIASLLILLFVYTGTSKLLGFEKFRIELSKSPLLTSFAGWVAWIIPVVEIVVAIMLAMPRFRLIALYGSFSLMVMFTAYLIAILQFSFYIPCTCGGVIQSMSWSAHIVFNCFFIFLSLSAILMYPRKTNTDVDTQIHLNKKLNYLSR